MSSNHFFGENFGAICFVVSCVELKEDIDDKENSRSDINGVVQNWFIEHFIDLGETQSNRNEKGIEDCNNENQ